MSMPYHSTFMQHPLPIPTQIYNNRNVQQQTILQQQQQQMELQAQYTYQVQQEQTRRFQDTVIQKRQIDERPVFNEMQGGQSPSKPWLGDDVYVVAFLLSVEMERLKEENQQIIQYVEVHEARYKQIDLIENELHNARIKMGEYEKHVALLQNEVDQWKNKNHNREKENEEIRYENEFQRRVMLDREIRELTAKFISDRKQMEQENNQLRLELDQIKLKKGSLDDVLMSAEGLQNENQRLKSELDKLRHGFDELEYVLKTASELELENAALKQKLQQTSSIQQQQNIHPPTNQILQENIMLKQQLDIIQKTPQQPIQNNPTNVRLQQELKRYQDENRLLRTQLGLTGGKTANTTNGGYCM